MDKAKTRVVAELIAVSSVVLSLLFVVYELRLSRDLAVAESYDATNASMFEFENLVTEHIGIWRRGCLGEELELDEEMIFARLVGANVDLMRTLWRRINTGITPTNPENFPSWIASSRHRFTGYNDMYIRYRLYMGQDVQTINPNGTGFSANIERFYRDFAESDEELVPDVAFCGR